MKNAADASPGSNESGPYEIFRRTWKVSCEELSRVLGTTALRTMARCSGGGEYLYRGRMKMPRQAEAVAGMLFRAVRDGRGEPLAVPTGLS
jgi:hypothetical protein